MTRDDLIIAFAKLRAHGYDARAFLLEHAAQLPARQRAAWRREVEAVAALYGEVHPAPKRQPKRQAPEDRKTRLTKRERAAWRRYAKDFPARLASHMRTC